MLVNGRGFNGGLDGGQEGDVPHFVTDFSLVARCFALTPRRELQAISDG